MTRSWGILVSWRVAARPRPARISLLGRNRRAQSTSNEKGTHASSGGFLSRNPGLPFGAAIGLLGFYIWRTVKSKQDFDKIKASIADQAVIAPYEAWEVRSSNSITPQIFDDISTEAIKAFPSGRATYEDFDRFLSTALSGVCPDGIKHGFNIERVMLAVPKDSERKACTTSLLTGFALTVNGSAEERLGSLYKMMKVHGRGRVSHQELEILVGHLMETHQIPPEKRVVESGEIWPVLKYRPAQADDLIRAALAEVAKPPPGTEGLPTEDDFGQESFVKMLTSKSICVWGECFSAAPAYKNSETKDTATTASANKSSTL